MTARILAKKIAGFALSKKASDVQLLDLRKVSDVADFFVLCSADSDVQVKAVADAVTDGLAESDVHPWHREGISQKQWILLDFIDVVVHVFHKDVRKFYALEKLWGDAKIEVMTDTPPPPRAKAAAPRTKASPATGKKTAPATGKKAAPATRAKAPPAKRAKAATPRKRTKK